MRMIMNNLAEFAEPNQASLARAIMIMMSANAFYMNGIHIHFHEGDEQCTDECMVEAKKALE